MSTQRPPDLYRAVLPAGDMSASVHFWSTLAGNMIVSSLMAGVLAPALSKMTAGLQSGFNKIATGGEALVAKIAEAPRWAFPVHIANNVLVRFPNWLLFRAPSTIFDNLSRGLGSLSNSQRAPRTTR